LLKECNGCAYTGVETVKSVSLFSDVSVYESKTQEHHNIRLVFSDNGVSVCGVLLRKHNKSKFDDYVVAGVFTDEHMRLKGFTKKGINVVEKIEIVVEHGVEREITIENIEAYLDIIFDTSSLKEEQCKILLNIALLQEDSIPMGLFEEVYLINNSSEKEILDAFNYNLKILAKKGWVKVENERIRVHGLVKTIILKRFLHRNDFFDSTADYLKETLKISGYHVQQSILYLKLSEAILENCTEKSASILLLQRAIAVCYTGIGLFNTSKTIWSNLQADNIYEVISKFHSLTVNAMNQGNSEQAFYYAEHVYSLFAPEVWQEDYSIIISNLETFLKNTQIKIEPIFRANNSLLVQLMSIEMVFNCQSIMTMHDKNKGIIEKINALKQGIFIRDQILSVFEKSISEELFFSIRVYKDFFIRKESYYRYIGRYYVELKEYLKAEEYLKSLLGTIETKLNNEYSILSFNYHSLTVLYLWWEKLENAKYFIEKNRKICETLPPNHPNTILYKNDIASLEKLEQRKNAEENIYTSIKSKFDLLFAFNNNSTSLWDYYYNLCCIYYDNNDMEKAYDYALKEIRFLLSVGENYNFLANAYIRLGMCCIPLGNLGCAEETYGLVTKLFTENKVNDPEILKKAHRFKDYLVKIAIHANNLPIMQNFVKSHVLLAEEYCNSKIVSKENAIFNVIKRAFDFLSGLPDLKDNINLTNTTENWVEFLEKKMEAFFVDYDRVFDNSLQEVAEIETFGFSLEEIKYDILSEYYQKIGDMFNNCEKWDVASQYYFRKLFLIESEYINDYKGIESAYYDISFCFFRLGQFEMSHTIICGGIMEIEEILEVQNHHPEYKERLKSALKASLKLEKIVKQKLEEFKK
jgi:tetratricopeptide (TPR) repeat protein